MRTKVAGCSSSAPDIYGLTFNYYKYYTPQNTLEEVFTSLCGFRHTVAKHKGVFVADLPDGSKVFAVKFDAGADEFPFINLVDYCTYKQNFIFIGTDIKKQAFFTPVF